jgi:hypothetical protein
MKPKKQSPPRPKRPSILKQISRHEWEVDAFECPACGRALDHSRFLPEELVTIAPLDYQLHPFGSVRTTMTSWFRWAAMGLCDRPTTFVCAACFTEGVEEFYREPWPEEEGRPA